MQFLVGLLIFSIAPHQRADLLIPLLPAASLLAGREASRLASIRGWRLVRVRTGLLVFLVAAPPVVLYHHVHMRSGRKVVNTVKVDELAAKVRADVGDRFPFTYSLTSPYAFQFRMNTYVPEVPAERAADPLAGRPAAFVCVSEPEGFLASLEERGISVYEVAGPIRVSGSPSRSSAIGLASPGSGSWPRSAGRSGFR